MRVLGLDVTPHGVFAVAMDMAFGRFEIRDTHEILPNTNEVTSEIFDPYAAARHLIDGLAKKPDRIVVSVPSDQSTFRSLHLATKDKRAIRSALEFELEDDLPFEREHLHFDSVILNLSAQGSNIHVGAVQKSSMKQLIESWNAQGIDPSVITTDVWAYRSLMGRVIGSGMDSPPTMLIGIERNKTFIYIHQNSSPVLYREVAFGQNTIEQHLMSTFQRPLEEVQAWIKDIGVSGVDEQVGKSIVEAMEPLIAEIKQSELSARATLKNTIDQIYLTGIVAMMPGIQQWFDEMTMKRSTLFRPLSQLSASQLSYSEITEVRFSKATALAMCLASIDKLPVLNLRKGEFAMMGAGNAGVSDIIQKVVPYAAIVLFTLFSTKFIESQYYKNKLELTDETLKIAVKNYFGGISENAARTYLADSQKLKKTIQNDLIKERELSKLLVQSKNSPLDFLKNLSSKVGKDIVVDLITFESGSDSNEVFKEDQGLKTNLKFIVSNAQNIARLTEILEKTFKLKKGPTEEVKMDGRNVFQVSFTGVINP